MTSMCSVCKKVPEQAHKNELNQQLYKCGCGYWKEKNGRVIFEDADSPRPTLHFLVDPQ